MAEQGTEEKTGSAEGESAPQDASSGEGTGRHAANDEASGNAAAEAQAPSEDPTEQSSEQKTEKSQQPSEQKTEKTQQPSEQKTEKTQQPSEQRTERTEQPSEAKTEKVEAQRGQGDTSWAEPERGPSGTPRHRSVDIGELAWRTGNVLATVVRTLALLFTLVLVVNVVLVLVGVNPANGVAQFIGAVADIVILGFRDLFIPSNPLVMLIVNSLVAAVFWVFVGELLSRLIRFLAARLS
jgi:hypothetical protein